MRLSGSVVIIIMVGCWVATARSAVALKDFYGTWETADTKCRFSREGTEGPYVTIGRGEFIPEGGGHCIKPKMRVRNDTLTITGRCVSEAGGRYDENAAFKMVRKNLIRSQNITYTRCGK